MESKSKRLDIGTAVERFMEAIEGEMFFSTGSVEEDFNIISGTINGQGYWAGSRHRYYFDKDFNLTKVEERTFGA